ncbi:MAG: hypothetical protein ACYDBB_13575 [Armatimonadota bacterium]
MRSSFCAIMPRTFTGLLLGCLLLAATLSARAALSNPKTAGKNGGAMSVLFILGRGAEGWLSVDPVVAKQLADEGYLVRSANDQEPLTTEYLRQFNTVVVVGLEDFQGGGYYNVGSSTLLNTAKTVGLLHRYVEDGGGLVFVPVMAEAGSQVSDIYNAALAPWKMKIGWETVRDDPNQVAEKLLSNYMWTKNITVHPITEGVKALLYPGQLLRWDDAYPTNPLMPQDAAWQVLVRGEATSQGMRNVNYKWSPADAGKSPALAAVRQAGKGRVGVVGLGAYYLVTHAYYAKKDEKGNPSTNLGENFVGLLDGVVYAKGDGKTPSDWGILFKNMLRWTAEAGTQAGLGGTPEEWTSKLAKIEVPNDPIPDFAAVNWKTLTLPTTWSHRVGGIKWWRGSPFYDEVQDPLVQKPQQMNKILIGAHSAYSDGKGTVADWVKAAKAAGFKAIVFTERFENLKGEEWSKFIDDCKANSSADFACMQGMDIADTQGNRFLILGNTNFPTGGMLSADGKALEMTARLSLGFSGHIAVMHRTGNNPTLPKELFRHFQGVSVYTYAAGKDGRYGLVDDAFEAYKWQLYNASNPVPIVVHELADPSEVAKNATIGFQEIVPSQDALDAIRYFRYGMSHFFENPQRYFISEGPIIDGFTIFNKDIGVCELNRDHWRALIGATSPDPEATINQAVLYDREKIARRWTPNKASFAETIDGEHDYQRYFMLEVTDSKGRRAISPHLRTVARGYFTRCGDRQNWFGAAGSYTGIWPSGTHGINYIYPSFPAGVETETFFAKEHPLATKMSLPFASNAMTFTDFNIDCKYIRPTQYGMDAWRIENTIPTTTYEAYARVGKWHDVATEMPDRNLTTLTTVETVLRAKKAFSPAGGLFPVVNAVDASNTYVNWKDGQAVEGKFDRKAETLIDLPAGASVGNYFLLTPLTISGKGEMGWRAEAGKEIPAGTEWKTAYVYLPRAWRASMGAEGPMPWSMKLTQGTMSTLGLVNMTAKNYGVAGTLKAGGPVKMLPLKISGLNGNWPAAMWTSDGSAYEAWSGLLKPKAIDGVTTSLPFLAHIGVCDNIGYAALPNTADVKFYAGNTLIASNPDLVLAFTLWTKKEAGIEVHNPTDKAITARITSAPIPGKYKVNKTVTVPAGSTVHVRLPK